ncbi:tRNA(Ile)-lysidine synthetase, partial [Cereibacter changlensis]
ATGRPRDSLIASPAVWQGDRLVAAPLAGLQNGWSAATGRLEEAFFLSVLSH